ncbi:MAG: GDP-mannose 4,6-dehydratase, partial [Candidatus Omnitrophica bacterium]|nr:GDP-mannose 4,6-dehydratase [Candidatus Omnitrophota bacterium]
TIITQLLNGNDKIKLGSLNPTRDFNYVKDTSNAFLAIANSDKVMGEEINIASEQDISIKQLAEKIIKKINPKAALILDKDRVRPENSEVGKLLGSNKKIKKLTDWRPAYDLDKGLEETISWFKDKKNLSLYKSDIYNV